MSKAVQENPDGEKKYVVSLATLTKPNPTIVIGAVRHEQEGDVEPQPGLQKDSAKAEDKIQGKTDNRQESTSCSAI